MEEELRRQPIDGLTFHFVAERPWPSRLGWTAGSTIQYFLWQWDAAVRAMQLNRDYDLDVLHHVSYGTLLGGSFLWRVGKPFVFGPVGGGQTAPKGFEVYFGKFWTSEALRSFTVKYLWPLDWPALMTARAAAVVLASNPETATLARRMGAQRVENMLSVCLLDEMIPEAPPSRELRESVRLLWVGRMLGRKAMQLTVEAVDLVSKEMHVELEMIGGGPLESEFARWLGDTERTHPVLLRGTLSWQSVQEAYDDADVFVLTSLRDTDGVQLLEAMAHALPIVTLDHQGAAELVPSDAGIKVPVTTPAATARSIAQALEKLGASADLRETMGAAGHRRAQQFPLSRRTTEIEALYASVTRAAPPSADHPSRDTYGALNAGQTGSEVDDFTGERYRQFSRYLPEPCRRVLDLGCGVGRGGRALKVVRPDLELVGLDVVDERLAKLPPGVYLSSVNASATELPFEDSSFDAVVAGEFIEHLAFSDADAVLTQVRRILRPGGRVLLTTPNPKGLNFRLKGAPVMGGPHLSEYTARDMKRRLRRHGFACIFVKGSGRATRLVGYHARPLSLYGSYLAVGKVPLENPCAGAPCAVRQP